MSERYDAVVVGAGVAGSSAAILLAEAGWKVAIVEKRGFPRRKVCGECIAATNFSLLDALGVGGAFTELAGPGLQRVGLYVGEETLQADLPRFADSNRPWGRALGREQLDGLLLARAAALGASVWQPWTVTGVARRSRLHVCELVRRSRDSARLEAPVVIGAQGSWEPGPYASDRCSPKRSSDLLAFKANFSGADLPSGQLPVLAFEGGYGGMVIADHGRLTLACCIRRARLRAYRAGRSVPGAGPAVEALLRESCRGVGRALADAEISGRWLAAGPLRPGIRTLWREPTGFAVGNAAGEAHPILGEGISMALQGSWLLCRHLIDAGAQLLEGESQAAVARRYERDWRRQFAGRVRWAALFAQLAMRPDAAHALLPLLRRRPDLLTLGARLGGKARSLNVQCGRGGLDRNRLSP